MLRPDVVQQLKARMRISHDSEDEYLDSLITASFAYLKRRCGDFSIDDIDENYVGKELVLERAKYTYEGNLEYFDENYQMMIHALSFDLGVEANEETL
ncbi:head-tail connector protein [Aerococcus urinaeequi]|uniref:Head-tail connector protein n=1 Tax=Aerococcus urinaeequi TaxID=51665 RepID=A0AAE9XQZ7_9LACT|nr:head-tail connector protein [Aerococcus urinaeequi]WCG37059.1 head-tail connector protein [Aerococcus urinaeequi]